MQTQLPQKNYGTTAGAHFGLFLTVVIWASTFINIKIVLQEVPPNTLAFLRFFIAAVVLGAYVILTRQPLPQKKDWPWILLSGLTGVCLYNFLQNQGLKYAGSTDAAILASLAPVFMALLAWLILKERISSRQVTGIAIAFAGCALVATNGSLGGLALNGLRLWGDFLILLTGMAWALYNICLKKLLGRYSATTVLAYSTMAGALFLLPLACWEFPLDLGRITWVGWVNILYLGLFASAMAYLLWNRGLSKVSTVTAGAYIYLIPVLTAIMGLLFFREVPGSITIIGGAMALFGTYFAGS